MRNPQGTTEKTKVFSTNTQTFTDESVKQSNFKKEIIQTHQTSLISWLSLSGSVEENEKEYKWKKMKMKKLIHTSKREHRLLLTTKNQNLNH